MTASVAGYLIERLKQAGVRHSFGVPGDYVLTFLDRVIAGGIDFVGTCNELNAGYAADAYARVNGIGCLVVTWGVGGFSAMNAVAGAYAEQVPLVVIVGGPRTTQRRSSMLLHHGVGDFTTMLRAFGPITVASVLLDDAEDAPARIDRTIARCMSEKRPVIIEIPADMVDKSCGPPGPFVPPGPPKSDPDALAEGLDEVMGLLRGAKSAAILAGVEPHRYGLMKDFLALVEDSRLPVATTLLGKTVISEHHPQSVGVYEGLSSRDEVRAVIEKADVLLCLGAWISDLNLGFYNIAPEARRMILANSGRLKIGHHVYEQVWIGDVIRGLAERMPAGGLASAPYKPVAQLLDHSFQPEPDRPLSVDRIMKRLNPLLSDDVTMIAETGDSLFAAADLVMHHDVGFIGQAFYLSIGYALPATLGASLADPSRRPLALIGDGAFQMTAQELSSLCRRKTNAIILLMNNDGYTTERVIHEGPYNDIRRWDYHRLPEVFGGGWGVRVATEGEFEEALMRARVANEGPVVIEVMLERLDSSEALKRIGAALSPDRKQG